MKPSSSAVSHPEPNAAEPVAQIHAGKRRTYTLWVLLVLFGIVLLMVIIAFINQLWIRQLVNGTVLIALGACILVLHRSREPLVWPGYVAIAFLHLIVTSGLITNGGVTGYAIATLPVLPAITALLLGNRSALASFGYVLLLALASAVATVQGVHPVNITPPDQVPMLAFVFVLVSSLAATAAIGSLIVTTAQSDARVAEQMARLQAEIAQRREVEEKLTLSLRSRSEFLSAISHELRTPLNGVMGFSHILEGEVLTERGQKCLANIRLSSSELLSKIESLLEYTEIASSRVPLGLQVFSLRVLFEALEQRFAARMRASSLQVSFNCARAARHWVRADYGKLLRTLSNLLDNAFKFTREGMIEVAADVKLLPADSVLVCRITDTGIGIRPEALNNLFTMFSQADMSSTRDYEGIGLGLAISAHYAQLMGGQLSVANNAHKGCTFTLQVPVDTDVTPVQDDTSAKGPRPA